MANIKEYASADTLQENLGLKSVLGEKISSILFFSSFIEFYLEKAIWKINKIDPSVERPITDKKPISELIKIFREDSEKFFNEDEKILIDMWCIGSINAFNIRNIIVHGVSIKVDDALSYVKDPDWGGVKRKHEPSIFWADEYSLDIVRDVMAVLLRIIFDIAMGNDSVTRILNSARHNILKEACSVIGELNCPEYNPEFEKY